MAGKRGPPGKFVDDPERILKRARRRAREAAAAARIPAPPPLPPALGALAPAAPAAPAAAAAAAEPLVQVTVPATAEEIPTAGLPDGHPVTRHARRAVARAGVAARLGVTVDLATLLYDGRFLPPPAEVTSVGVQTEPVPAPVVAFTGVQTDPIQAPEVTSAGAQTDTVPVPDVTSAGAQTDPAPAPTVTSTGAQTDPVPAPAAATPTAVLPRGKPAGVGPRGKPIVTAPAGTPQSARPRLLKNELVRTPAASGVGSGSAAPGYTNLIQVESKTACTFGGAGGARLRVTLQVYTNDDPAFRTYMGYYAYVYLRRPGEDDYEDIGSISSWRFSRRTARDPNVDGGLWAREWLEGDMNDKRYSNSTACIAQCQRAIYNADGSVKDRVAPEFREELSNDGKGNDLVYIQQLYIRDKSEDGGITYSGNDYARQALNAYYTLMTGGVLPAWYHIGGPVTFILEPGLLDHPDMGATWRATRREGETDDDLAARVAVELTGIYCRRGYKVYADIETDLDHGFSTLGRRVVPGQFPRGARDRVVGTWWAGKWVGDRNPSPGERGPPSSAKISPTPVRNSRDKGKGKEVETPGTPTPAPRGGTAAGPSGTRPSGSVPGGSGPSARKL